MTKTSFFLKTGSYIAFIFLYHEY